LLNETQTTKQILEMLDGFVSV